MTPLAGRLARLQTVISATTVAHEFEDWDLTLNSNLIPVPGFEIAADGDGNTFNKYLAGLVDGEANFNGRMNSAKNPTASFKPGVAHTYTSLFCGYTSAIGYTLTGKSKGIRAGTRVQDAGTFGGSFQIEGVTYPT